MQSPRFHLNNNDISLIFYILFHGLIGIALTLISEVFTRLDYGSYTAIVSVALAGITSFLRQYVSGPSSSDIEIQQLKDQIKQLTEIRNSSVS